MSNEIIIVLITAIVAPVLVPWLTRKLQNKSTIEEMLTNLEKRIDEIGQMAEGNKVAVRVLLQNEIRRAYKFYRNEGQISSDDLERMLELAEAANVNGANGTLQRIVDCIKQLPVV